MQQNYPKMVRPTTLIRVATGQYKEILPIIVPAECCIMGDELRATNVQPKTIYNGANLTSRSDTPFSFEALTRLEPVVGDIVRGVTLHLLLEILKHNLNYGLMVMWKKKKQQNSWHVLLDVELIG